MEKNYNENTPLLDVTNPVQYNEKKEYENGGSPNYDEVHPEHQASCISRATFWWLNSVVIRGSKKFYEQPDLLFLRTRDTSSVCAANLKKTWKRELLKSTTSSTPPSLTKAIINAFGFNMYLAGICKLLGDLFGFVSPICLNGIVKYLVNPDTALFLPEYYGYILALILFLANICSTLCLHQHHHLVIREGIHVRSALSGLVFEKSLRLTSYEKQKLGTGRIMNHQSNDAQRVMDVFYYIHYIWAAPLQILISLILLINFLGYSSLAGLGVMLILLPISGLVASLIGRISKNMITQTDQRVKLLNEILQGIRVVKFYAWEDKLAQAIKAIRSKEIACLTSNVFCNSFNATLLQGAPILVALASFTAFTFTENSPLTPDVAFTAISLFNIFRLPLMILPRIFSFLVQARVAINRIQEYLETDEIEKESLENFNNTKEKSIEIINSTFVLDPTQPNISLKDLNLKIPSGELSIIIGSVGSGKSTLVSAILGELVQEKGTLKVNGSVAYIAQHAWILNASIKDNILFGKAYDSNRFHEVLRICALEMDLKTLAAGIETEVGERGVTLSGGQKQRISIARAIYADKDIYIFDDCLSALDSHVGQHVFEKCIDKALRHKTRLLVTHALQYLDKAHQVIVMSNMKIQESGTYSELMNSNGTLFSMVNGIESLKLKEDKEMSTSRKSGEESIEDYNNDNDGKLMKIEDRNVGGVSSKVYFSYISSCGVYAIVVISLLVILAQWSTIANDLWLSFWTGTKDYSEMTTMHYLQMYAILSGISIFLIFLSDILCQLSGLRASQRIHEKLFSSVLKAPIQFFDTTPVGRIINRFSNDIYVVDQQLNSPMKTAFSYFILIMNYMIVQCFASPLVIFVIVPSFGLYLWIQTFFRKTSRELQRLNNISRSPIYALFGQTLDGLPTLRAYQMEESFILEIQSRMDRNTQAFWLLNLINRWLGVRLEFLGAVITLSVAILMNLSLGFINPAFAGLVLTYAQTITGLMNWTVRTNIDVENAMNSVERTDEYTLLEKEASYIISSNRPPSNWPTHGDIIFKNISARYRKDLDLVLKNISFKINGGEKIGICGRTGSGKSSLMLILFRLLEQCEGKVFIDNIDTSRIGLFDLRSKMAIIPQDPVLFAHTVRFNLDPFSEHNDVSIWKALGKAKLIHVIESIPNQLDGMITEGGENFSAGERQLFCLARALLRGSKVLVLDEATASVDHKTDEYIQQRIRDDFKECTVIAIAHRLETIVDYDRIMVLEKGEIKEYDTPNALLNKKSGALLNLAGDRAPNLLKLLQDHQLHS